MMCLDGHGTGGNTKEAIYQTGGVHCNQADQRTKTLGKVSDLFVHNQMCSCGLRIHVQENSAERK
jgi:hypothetical protein